LVLEPSARTEPKPEFDDTNSKIAAMVKLLTKYGPQINRIGRELGIHKETIRYWYKGLLKKGYTLTAVPNYERLGLKRVVVLAEFSEKFAPYADAILMAMSELCYLSSFAKTLTEDVYSIQANVPEAHMNEWIRFIQALKRRGLFEMVQVAPFDWVWVVPMRSELYDFENESWQFDWISKANVESSSTFTPSATGKFDRVDLDLLKQLQMEPDVTIFEIADNLRVNYKTLSWHQRMHVEGNGLLKGFLVNWTGTRYDPKIEKALHRRHRYMWIELLVVGVSESERIELMAKVNRIPFVWLEAGGQNFFVQIAFPSETMTEALGFIKEVVSPFKQKASWHFMDQANALRFSMTPGLYDQDKRVWRFDQADLLSRFDKLVLEIKGTTS
jgi:DNA-binding Lrp family transcriptional regulator